MLAKSMERFESHLQIGRFARQKRITALFAAQQHDEARRLFAEWFRDQLDSGTMPVIGEELYKAYVTGPKGNELFAELITSEAKRLLETQRLMTVNLLAIQISQLGDLPLADRLMTMLIEKLNVEQRPDVSLLAIEHLRRFNDPRAATLLDRMLELPSVSDLPQIWRFAATMAESSGHKRLAIDRMELAIQMEFATRPTTINIETVRADYTALLAKYKELINAAATLETAPPEGLAERIIQAADQWRSLDDDDTAACQTAARLLAKLHQKDMAWDYQITPLAENSGESAPWINLARQLTTDKSFILADMAWSRAFEFESSNPEILLEHAKMRLESKSKDAAKALLQRIESGSWQPRFQQSVQEAGRLLMSL